MNQLVISALLYSSSSQSTGRPRTHQKSKCTSWINSMGVGV